MSNLKDTIVGRLALQRKQLGISQEYLAEILGLDQTYISKTETGKRQLTVDEFVRWCDALNIPLNQIVEILYGGGKCNE